LCVELSVFRLDASLAPFLLLAAIRKDSMLDVHAFFAPNVASVKQQLTASNQESNLSLAARLLPAAVASSYRSYI